MIDIKCDHVNHFVELSLIDKLIILCASIMDDKIKEDISDWIMHRKNEMWNMQISIFNSYFKNHTLIRPQCCGKDMNFSHYGLKTKFYECVECKTPLQINLQKELKL